MGGLLRFAPLGLDPGRELEELGERFNRLLGRPSARPDGSREAMTVADWIPPVDIAEDDKEYLIKVELPEVDKDNVKIMVQEGVLTIQGERKKEKEEDSKKFHRIERAYGRFVRVFTLPEDAREDNIKAEFKDGVLYVHLQKTEKPKPKTVEVKVA